MQDEQQDGDGEHHSDLESQLLSSVVRDEEGGEIQTQEEEDGQQEVDDVEEGPPLNGELGQNRIKGQMGSTSGNRHFWTIYIYIYSFNRKMLFSINLNHHETTNYVRS